MNRTQTANKLKGQIREFSGILSSGLPKVAKRFVGEVVYGMLSRQSVHVAEVARSLNEPIRLIKTLNRLCRQMGRAGLWGKVTDNLIREGAQHVGRDTLLIVDISDISKKYAKKMQHLAEVRDGSEGTIGKGYWTVQVVGAEVQTVKVVPVYERLYSQNAPDFVSENEEILRAVRCVRTRTQERGIWVMDRGGDRNELMIPLLEDTRRFLIRLRGDRHLVYHGHRVSALDLATSCRMLYAERIIREDRSEEKARTIEFGFRRVRLPGSEEELSLVVVKGFGEEPLMLLTNVEVKTTRRSVLFIVQAYIRRWQVEETIRFAKQTYGIEDIRLRKYVRLQNMIALALGALYFVMGWLGEGLKLRILMQHALTAAKRLFVIPDFRYYAAADGIKSNLEGCQTPFRLPGMHPRADPQLMLPI
jgi:hypothetical protein